MRLSDLQGIAECHRERGHGFESFRREEALVSLRWPDDVLEQWLYDHPDHFIHDYGHIDLTRISWGLEALDLDEFLDIPTGKSETDLLHYNAEHHAYLVDVRGAGALESWQTHGTWKRPPVLVERHLVDPGSTGLQVVEGRTRVGVLRGRAEHYCFVAKKHLAWVGRPLAARPT